MSRRNIDNGVGRKLVKAPPVAAPLPPGEEKDSVAVSVDADRADDDHGSPHEPASGMNYLDAADVDSDTRDAAPADADQAIALAAAEQAGREHGAVTRKKTSDGA